MPEVMDSHDEDRVRRMLKVDSVPDAFRKVYFRVRNASRRVTSGAMQAETLAVLCEMSGCLRQETPRGKEPKGGRVHA